MRFKNYLLVLIAFLAYSQQDAIHLSEVGVSMGIVAKNVFGGEKRKDFILETTGNGVAVVDLDGDGARRGDAAEWDAVGEESGGAGEFACAVQSASKGEFTSAGGFSGEGWAQGVCAGDVDNDGRLDLLFTYYGHNRLYRNLGENRFEDATAKVGLPVTGRASGVGARFSIMTATAGWTCLCRTT